MQRDFFGWHELKSELDAKGSLPTFKPREIWWCCIGINVGHEENGKGRMFHRPVLIIKKFNHRLFWGIPLSTKRKNKPHYHNFKFLGRAQSAMLTHLRLYDSQRLMDKMGRLAEAEFRTISKKLKGYLP